MFALEGLFPGVDVGVLQVVRLQMKGSSTARMVADEVFYLVVHRLDVSPQGIICGIGRITPPKIALACLLSLLISRTNHGRLLHAPPVLLLDFSPVYLVSGLSGPGHLNQLLLPLFDHLKEHGHILLEAFRALLVTFG